MCGHEAHADVQEGLFDVWRGQRGMEEGHQDLEDSRKLPGDLRWIFNQDGLQEAHHALQLHIQLTTKANTLPPPNKRPHFLLFSSSFRSYPLEFLANRCLFFQLGLHHFLLFAR